MRPGGLEKKRKKKKKKEKKKSVLIRFYDNRNIKKTIFVSCCSTRYRNCRESLSSVNPPRNKAERERKRERRRAGGGGTFDIILRLLSGVFFFFSFLFGRDSWRCTASEDVASIPLTGNGIPSRYTLQRDGIA